MKLSATNFIRKNWSKSFNNRIVYNTVRFKCICASFSWQYTEIFYKLFTRATESGRLMRGCNFGKIWPINVRQCHVGKVYVFRQEMFKLVEFFNLKLGLYPCISDIAEAMNTLIQVKHNHREICITVKVSPRTQKVEIYIAKERSGVAIFSTDLGHILEFSQAMNLK